MVRVFSDVLGWLRLHKENFIRYHLRVFDNNIFRLKSAEYKNIQPRPENNVLILKTRSRPWIFSESVLSNIIYLLCCYFLVGKSRYFPFVNYSPLSS